MQAMEPITLLLLALASARITLLITRDAILEPIRHWIFLVSPPPDNKRHGWNYQQLFRANKRERNMQRQHGMGWWESRWAGGDAVERQPGWFGSLLSCPDCVGVWVGAGWYTTWVFAPEPVLAVSGALSLAMVASWIARKGGYS